ncbi:MAG: serine/threonine protein kinase [Elusimicrobiales bacterium]|nr:serine/threonine protein kinase [Elusimicrobiales bacterium]
MTDDITHKTFAGCLVLEKIGQGGMGIVYKAHHIKLNKIVCIKILSKELEADPRNIDFFLREAEISKQLDHPNTVHVYDFGKEKDRYYIVMSYVEGKSLEQIVKEKKFLKVEEASEIMIGIMKGLEHAHSKNIIHRDIKPSNIIINNEGIPRIIDFGLARRIVEEKQLTIAGEMIGTAYFMSPEQCLGEKIDWRSDLYSAGATYFYILTGKYPFDGKTSIEVINQHVNSPIPNLYLLKPELPIWTVRMIEKLMKKKPEERYQSATEVLKELEIYKKNGYKNIILDNQIEIELPAIKNLENEEKQEHQTLSNQIINSKPQTNFDLEKKEADKKEKKVNLQDEKTFIIKSLILHTFITFICAILIIIYGYLSLSSKINSLIILLLTLLLIIKAAKKTKTFGIYLTLYGLFFISIHIFSNSLENTNIYFLQYLEKLIRETKISLETFFPFSLLGVLSIHLLHDNIKNNKLKKILFPSLFLILATLAYNSVIYTFQKNFDIMLNILNIKLLSILIILSIIFGKYVINLYLLSFLIITFFTVYTIKTPFIEKQTQIRYQKEHEKYQLEIKKTESKIKEEIFLKISEGNIYSPEMIKKEINKKISEIKPPDKEKIKFNIRKEYDKFLLSQFRKTMKNSSFLIGIFTIILTNIIYIVKLKQKLKYEN